MLRLPAARRERVFARFIEACFLTRLFPSHSFVGVTSRPLLIARVPREGVKGRVSFGNWNWKGEIRFVSSARARQPLAKTRTLSASLQSFICRHERKMPKRVGEGPIYAPMMCESLSLLLLSNKSHPLLEIFCMLLGYLSGVSLCLSMWVKKHKSIPFRRVVFEGIREPGLGRANRRSVRWPDKN